MKTQRRGTSDCPWLRRWNAGRTGAIRYLAPASPLEAEQKDIARDNAERVCKIGRPTKAIHSGCLNLLAGPVEPRELLDVFSRLKGRKRLNPTRADQCSAQ